LRPVSATQRAYAKCLEDPGEPRSPFRGFSKLRPLQK
jgi:hypothetical protein